MTDALTRLLATRDWLMADGATGTNLFNMGLSSGDAPEMWNIEHPDNIRSLYRSAVDAGSDIFLTNSFGGNASRMKLHGAQNRVHELNRVAASLGGNYFEYLLGRFTEPAELFGPVEVAKKYGVPEENAGQAYCDLATLRGDASDGPTASNHLVRVCAWRCTKVTWLRRTLHSLGTPLQPNRRFRHLHPARNATNTHTYVSAIQWRMLTGKHAAPNSFHSPVSAGVVSAKCRRLLTMLREIST